MTLGRKLELAGGATVVLTVMVLGFLAHLAFKRAETFERRAQRAETVAALLRPQIDSLQASVDSLQRVTTRRDTVIKVLRHNVFVIDSLSPPPDTCRPNLAARDSVIAEQGRQVEDLTQALHSERRANILLRQALDSALAALAVRPKYFPRFLGPNLGLGVAVGVDPTTILKHPQPEVRIGISLNIMGIRL